MLKLSPSSVMTSYLAESPGEERALESLLEREVENQEDPYRFYTDDRQFPTGLLSYVLDGLAKKQVPVDCPPLERGPLLPVPPDILKGVTLRPYQCRTTQKGIYRKRGLFEIGTSGGKTEIYGALIRVLNLPSLAVLGQVKHAKQMYDRLVARGVPQVGWLGHTSPGFHNVVVSDTAWSRIRAQDGVGRLIREAQVLCFDETHHLGTAKTWQAISRNCEAEYRFGLSATCFEHPADRYRNICDMELIGLTGEPIVQIPASFLISEGYAMEPEILFIPIQHTKVNPHLQYYKTVYERGVVNNVYRNEIITRLTRSLSQDPSARILVLVQRISHGQDLLLQLAKKGVVAKFSCGGGQVYKVEGSKIEGYYDGAENYVDEFVSGQYNVLLGSVIYDEATDIPVLTDLIMAAAGRKSRRMKQRIGRGLRKADGKTYFRLWEFWDAIHFMLKWQSKSRWDTYESEGYKPRMEFPTALLGE